MSTDLGCQVSYACPWAHRTLIVRKLKGLEDIIPITSVHWHMQEKGWRFATPQDNDAPGAQVTADPIKGHEKFTHLRDLYFHVDPEYKGRFTVPTLYDVKQDRIVSNESSEIIRMFYTEVCWCSEFVVVVCCRAEGKYSSTIFSRRNTRA
jgi:putative glutathione S-transferase